MRGRIPFAIPFVALVLATVPAFGQITTCPEGPADPNNTNQLCCTGPGCGAGVPAYSCHSVSTANVQCWGRNLQGELGPFNACELVPGFRLTEIPGGEAPTATACFGVVAGSSVNDRLLRGIGGYTLFESQILRRAQPRIARETAATREEADDETTPDEESALESETEDSEAAATAAVFADISTTLEAGNWDFRSFEGDAAGLRLFWTREGETGRTFGVSGSYQESDPDFGESTRLLNGNLSFGHTVGASASWGVNATVSDFSGIVDDTLIGASGFLAFSRYSDSGSVFSGGVLFQYLSSDRATEDVQTVGYGAGFGLPVGKRLALDVEVYGVSILETYRIPLPALIQDGESVLQPDLVSDDSFFTAGAQVSFYITPRFAVMLGYRVLEGIDDLDSQTFTFGGSTRWQ